MKIHEIQKEKLRILFLIDDSSEFYEMINNHLSHIKNIKTGKYAYMCSVILKNEEDFQEALKILSNSESK